MSVAVRVAGDGDVEVLTGLRRTWAEEDAGGEIDDVAFEREFHDWWASERTTRTFFILEIDGEAVGMGNVKCYSRMPSPGRPADTWGYVGNVFVRADRRNSGAGAALMEAMVAWSWEQGHDKLRLSPAPRAVPFYERLRFAPSALLQRDR